MTTIMEMMSGLQASQSTGEKLIRVAPLAMISSSATNVGLYLAAGKLAPEVAAWPGASVVQVVGATIVYLLIGSLICAAVSNWSVKPAQHYLVIATAGLLLSLVPPINAGLGYSPPGVPAAELATVVTLMLMHIVSYAISVPMLIRHVLE